MLFAVEGGGFFSSSASGYSKGLSLLLLGQKNEEEKQMRITPWNHHYQLVDQDSEDPADLQLASSGKNQLARRCASFVCFRRTGGAGPDNSSGQKVGPTTQLQDSKGKDGIHTTEGNDVVKEIPLKSNLKKPTTSVPVPCWIGDEHEALCEEDGNMGRRKVQWTDVFGGELVDIREFEPSEDELSDDDEFDVVNEKTCVCRIM